MSLPCLSTLFNQRVLYIHLETAKHSLNGACGEQMTSCVQNAAGRLAQDVEASVSNSVDLSDFWASRATGQLWYIQLHWSRLKQCNYVKKYTIPGILL